MRAGSRRLVLLLLLWLAPDAALWGQVPAAEAVTATDGQEDTLAQPGPIPPARQPANGPLPPAAQQPVEGGRAAAGPAVEASQLDTFLLRDSKGNLVPVLGMPFEEFERLLRIQKGLAPPPAPGYTLDALSLVGTADGDVANLQLTATIRVRDEGWIRVPLQMPTAVVRQPPKYEGPGEQFLTFDAASGGYLLWLKGADAKPHVVTVPVSLGLSSSGDQTLLAVSLPRATEASLRVTVAEPRVEAALAQGEGIVSTKPVQQRTEISVLGPAGEVSLQWRKGREVAAKGPVQLDASGEVVVNVESEHRVWSEARLRVRGYGGPLESFQVRLPPGMTLVTATGPRDATLTPQLPAAEASGRQRPGQVVDVRFDPPASGIAEIRLVATLQADAAPAAALPAARFEVLGAVRQRGTIDFEVAGEWQLEWTEDPTVRRLDLAADASRPRLVARYEYFRQPCGLLLKVSARPSRISVEPTHTVFVDAGQLRVVSTLKYRLRGARATSLAFEVDDWKSVRLSPDDLLDMPVANSESPARVEAPFRLGAIAPTELELTLEAHRTLPPGATEIEFSLPRPVADLVAPATVVIAPADNVELTPQTERMIGLSPDAAVPRIPQRQQAPLVYRDLGGNEPALFAAVLRVKTRAATVGGRAQVRLDKQQIQVEQQLDYRIAHEPQRSFRLLVPRGLASGGSLQVRLNGDLVTLRPADVQPENGTLQRLEFTAPSDQIGSVPVQVRYTLPMPAWDGEKPLPVAIPLVVPPEEPAQQFTGQEVSFVLAEGLQIEPEAQAVEALALETQPGGGSRAFRWPKAASTARWIVQPSALGQSASIHVSKAWVQTWLAPPARQERAAFRLTTAQDAIRVRLPAGAARTSVQAAINGQEIAVQPRDPGVLRIDVPAAVRGREFVLEVWYALDAPPRSAGLVAGRLAPATIEGAAPPRRMYWQLSMPEDEHLVSLPPDLAVEMAWRSQDWFVARTPLLDQRQLEGWIGASRQDPLPRGTNEYLFGALGRTPSLHVAAAHRRLMLVAASGGALLVGLLLIHVPAARSPSVLVAGAVVLGGVALALPDLAVLVGQMAVLGIAVVVAASAWSWLGWGRAAGRMPVTVRPRERPRETASTQSPVMRPERSPLSTATAPAGAAEVRP